MTSTEGRPRLVIDADAAIASARLDRLVRITDEFDVFAPPLLWSETSSALHRGITRFGRDADQERLVFDRIDAAGIQSVSVERRGAPWDVADLLGWSKTYDAEYLVVARQVGASLFSIDRSLRHGASLLGIELVTPS